MLNASLATRVELRHLRLFRRDMGKRLGRLVVLFAAATSLIGCASKLPQNAQDVRIPLTVQNKDGTQTALTLAATYYPTKSGAPMRLVVINHGSTDSSSTAVTERYEWWANWYLSKGFAVIVPMRRGRGQSGGQTGENSCCIGQPPRYGALVDCSKGLEEAIEDLDAVLKFARTLDGVRDVPVIMTGVSRGGFLSTVYARRRPSDVAGVINFVGGWSAEGCNDAVNLQQIAVGARLQEPKQLWLYGDRDDYYSESHIRAIHSSFQAAGGSADLHVFKGVGHWTIFSTPPWGDISNKFLSSIGLLRLNS